MNTFLLISFSLLFVIQPGTIKNHDFHVSKCDIVYDHESEALQVTLHIFIDDLENALAERGYEKLYLCTDKELDNANQYIAEYISDKLKISVDLEKVNLSFLGKEVSDDLFAVWCYLEKTDVRPKNEINVEYSLLMDIFGDQRNIVKLDIDKNNKTHFLLDKKNSSGKLILK